MIFNSSIAFLVSVPGPFGRMITHKGERFIKLLEGEVLPYKSIFVSNA
jgi:hypothetical protein